ncbi:MAG: PEP-CTERM sorting domain-containing protein [Planctomycetales bacterium]|nr:PEP-CTERM sorting domain-containing protein [Planctomycetales bacterium]
MMKKLLTRLFITGIALALSATSVHAAGDLLFIDLFDVPDSASFDAAETAGRTAGTVAGETLLKAHRAQQEIRDSQLYAVATAGVRFENTAGTPGATNRYDWAAGSAGGNILSAGGFSVSFDWTPTDDVSTNWVAWAVGTANADSGASVVNEAQNDYGILFRNNGGTERFINGGNQGAGGSFATAASHHVMIDYEFDSFADGSNVTATSYVDGTQVASDIFAWNNNGGAMYMEFASNQTGSLIDNLTVSTVPEPSAGILFLLSLIGLVARRRR